MNRSIAESPELGGTRVIDPDDIGARTTIEGDMTDMMGKPVVAPVPPVRADHGFQSPSVKSARLSVEQQCSRKLCPRWHMRWTSPVRLASLPRSGQVRPSASLLQPNSLRLPRLAQSASSGLGHAAFHLSLHRFTDR